MAARKKSDCPLGGSSGKAAETEDKLRVIILSTSFTVRDPGTAAGPRPNRPCAPRLRPGPQMKPGAAR